MKLNVTGATLIKQVVGNNRRSTSRINAKHPDTLGWKLEIRCEGLLCTLPSGELKLIPLSNVIEMAVEVADNTKPQLKVKAKTTLKKAR